MKDADQVLTVLTLTIFPIAILVIIITGGIELHHRRRANETNLRINHDHRSQHDD